LYEGEPTASIVCENPGYKIRIQYPRKLFDVVGEKAQADMVAFLKVIDCLKIGIGDYHPHITLRMIMVKCLPPL